MTLAQRTSAQLAELEADIRDGSLSWRALEKKHGASQSTIRDWARRHGVLRGLPAHQRAVHDALDEGPGDDDAAAVAERIAMRALRRVDVELVALLSPTAAALDPRNLKLLLESASLALDLRAKADPIPDLEGLTDQQLEALAAGRRLR